MRAIRLGRTLGDAFVWFFYRDDPALLQEHAQTAAVLPPAGDGGEGELALIDAVRFFGEQGHSVSRHHDDMFRLGDASLA